MTTPSQHAAEQDRSTTPADGSADHGEAPVVPAAEDVRTGPEDSDEPQAGAAEPTD